MFLAPHLALMRMPVVGPLLFLPASAASAFLADLLHRAPRNARYLAPAAPQGGPSLTGGDPQPASSAVPAGAGALRQRATPAAGGGPGLGVQ